MVTAGVPTGHRAPRTCSSGPAKSSSKAFHCGRRGRHRLHCTVLPGGEGEDDGRGGPCGSRHGQGLCPMMRMASAVVAEEGTDLPCGGVGLGAGYPLPVDAVGACSTLKDGTTVTVDGSRACTTAASAFHPDGFQGPLAELLGLKPSRRCGGSREPRRSAVLVPFSGAKRSGAVFRESSMLSRHSGEVCFPEG